jgi:hypothetical protein
MKRREVPPLTNSVSIDPDVPHEFERAKAVMI